MYLQLRWMKDAACRHKDPDFFFPEGKPGRRSPDSTEPHSKEEMEKERSSYCYWSRCPVRDECLEYALRNNINQGVWGGKTSEERKDKLRSLKIRGVS